MPKADARDRQADRPRFFREGDREAFSELYRVHHLAVFRFALNMTGDRGKAADLNVTRFSMGRYCP